MKKILVLMTSLYFLAGVLACAEDPVDFFETAQFEEKQNNLEYAEQLYHKIINKYPESDYAGKAEARIEEWEGLPDN